MCESNFELLLYELKVNRFNYDNLAQIRDADLICNLLRLKYNSLEINQVTEIIKEKLQDCNNKSKSWFTNY